MYDDNDLSDVEFALQRLESFLQKKEILLCLDRYSIRMRFACRKKKFIVCFGFYIVSRLIS